MKRDEVNLSPFGSCVIPLLRWLLAFSFGGHQKWAYKRTGCGFSSPLIFQLHANTHTRDDAHADGKKSTGGMGGRKGPETKQKARITWFEWIKQIFFFPRKLLGFFCIRGRDKVPLDYETPVLKWVSMAAKNTRRGKNIYIYKIRKKWNNKSKKRKKTTQESLETKKESWWDSRL
jgi:hypothetical protein